MADAKKVGARSRRKGANGERELAAILREYGYDVRRGIQSAGESDVIGLPGIHLEVKRREKLQLEDWMAQARRDARPEELPTVWHRRNNCEWLVTMPLEVFMILYREFGA